jgi:hypothetical protein
LPPRNYVKETVAPSKTLVYIAKYEHFGFEKHQKWHISQNIPSICYELSTFETSFLPLGKMDRWKTFKPSIGHTISEGIFDFAWGVWGRLIK